MNTKIEYMYRDASNYKNHGSILVAGEMTENKWKAMLSACTFYFSDEPMFAAETVDFEDLHFSDYGEDDFSFQNGDGADHVLTGYENVENSKNPERNVDSVVFSFLRVASGEKSRNTIAILTPENKLLYLQTQESSDGVWNPEKAEWDESLCVDYTVYDGNFKLLDGGLCDGPTTAVEEHGYLKYNIGASSIVCKETTRIPESLEEMIYDAQ